MKKVLKVLAVILILVEIFALAPKTMQNDTFWSIKVGEEFITNGKITEDTLGQNTGLNYIAQHYLTDIIIYFVHNLFGFLGLYIFEIVLMVILAILLYMLNKQLTKNSILSYVFLTVQLLMLTPFFAVRAQMVSFIFFVLELLLLEKLYANYMKKYIVGLAIIPFLLANFHMGVVPMYFIILGVYGLGCIKPQKQTNWKLLKTLILIGVIGLVTIFINPYFLDGVIYPFKTLGNSFISENIQEFRPYSLSTPYTAWVLLYIFTLGALMILLNKKIQVKDYLLIAGTLFMNFMAIRYTSLFIICSSVIVRYLNFEDILNEKDIVNNKWIIFVILSILIVIFGVRGVYTFTTTDYDKSDVYPKEAIEYLVEHSDENMIIYNEYAYGSGLMLNGIKPFIDSRCDMYTEEYNNVTIADDYITIYRLGQDFDKLIEKYNFNTFLIQTDSAIARVFKLSDKLNLVYEDELASIFVIK